MGPHPEPARKGDPKLNTKSRPDPTSSTTSSTSFLHPFNEAVAIFALNVKSFPQSWNAYDSLAESYLAAGNQEAAVENYQKSLDLHPGNISGIVALQKISANSPKDHRSATDELATSELTKGVDETVRSLMSKSHIPGVAVVIVKDGKTIFKRGYGVANVEQSTKVDPDKTLFRIGSVSKALTLLSLTRQIDQGRLKLDDDVSDYFEGIENPHGFKQPVTIENLLTHTSGFDQIGIGRHVRSFDRTLAERKSMRAAIAEFLKASNLRRVTRPGEYFRYDTYGSTLAGAVIERVTGLPYAKAMQKEMFEQLGMDRTFVEADTNHFGDLATGYGYVGGSYVAQPYEVYATTPASSIDSTPTDMGRLLEALTGGGENSHGRLFSSEMAKAVLSPQFRPHPEFRGVTHGLFESNSRSREFERAVRTVGHGGSMKGFFSAFSIVPEHNLGIFVVANRAPESGGGGVPIGSVLATVICNLPDVPVRKNFDVPKRVAERDLSEYSGDYFYGVFCHECTAEEVAQGAWQRGDPRTVTENEGMLTIGDDEYIPAGDDVFVRSDGQKRVFFGRDENKSVSFFVYSSSVDTFERGRDE